MYTLVRVLEFIVLLVIYAFILRILYKKEIIKIFSKNKNPALYQLYKTNNKFKRISILTNISICLIGVFLGLVSRYPIEAHFIEFPTLENSFGYKGINIDNLDVFEYDDCAFAINKKSGKMYTVTGNDGRYRLVDFRADDDIEYAKADTPVGFCEDLVAKHNKETDKTFYYITVCRYEEDKPENVQLDSKTMKYFSKDEETNPSVFLKSAYGDNGLAYKYKYIYLDNNCPKDCLSINIDEESGIFAKPPYIRGITHK